MASKKKSTVNEAGNYTKPELRKRLFNEIKAKNVARHSCRGMVSQESPAPCQGIQG